MSLNFYDFSWPILLQRRNIRVDWCKGTITDTETYDKVPISPRLDKGTKANYTKLQWLKLGTPIYRWPSHSSFWFLHLSSLLLHPLTYQLHSDRRLCRKDRDSSDILAASVWHALRLWSPWAYCLLEIIVHIMLLLLAIRRIRLQSHFDFYMINSIVLSGRQFPNVTLDSHGLSLLSRCFCRIFLFRPFLRWTGLLCIPLGKVFRFAFSCSHCSKRHPICTFV